MTSFIPSARACVLAGLAALAILAPVSGAGAQWFTGPMPYYSERQTRGPDHGYSGWTRFGARQYFCDYQRIPNRVCRVDRNGRERCRVEGWTLKQYCY